MDDSYIAGFFDGEGSAVVLTVRQRVRRGIAYRFRPAILIAQATPEPLEAIQRHLGYGTVVRRSRSSICRLQINGLMGVLDFAERIMPLSILKAKQLRALREMVLYHRALPPSEPYTRRTIEHLLKLRDRVFHANTWTRSNLSQKYPRERVLAEHTFVDVARWRERRSRRMRSLMKERWAAKEVA